MPDSTPSSLPIDAIRMLAIDAVQRADSGHPGAPMGLAECAFALWTRHMKYDPKAPQWPDRDRFVLSNGHASMLLYAMLHLVGVEAMTIEQIKNFRQWGSLTPGHPEAELTPGVEVTTGPLGQGIATSVGLAMAEARLAAEFEGLIDHHTYVICSDGDLMEGVSHEAASLAGHLQLGKLIVLYDDNHITIDGTTDLSFSEDVGARFEACGWQVLHVDDGHDIEAIDGAIEAAKLELERPTLISVRTIIGYGSPNKANSSSSHGSPLGDVEIKLVREHFDWPHAPFEIPQEVRDFYSEWAKTQAQTRAQWEEKLAKFDRADALKSRFNATLPPQWHTRLPTFPPDPTGMATRASGGKVLAAVFGQVPALMGGSADLAGSNKTFHKEFGVFTPKTPQGRNVHFGVREHAMAAAANGICLHGGTRGFGATFLIFSDYMKPALRLAALMHQPQLMVFTHDSIGLGEDGPTHQPIEHLMALRAVPNYWVFRPADANEVTACWHQAIERTSGPSCLVLTRQEVPTLDLEALGTKGQATQGGYVVAGATHAAPKAIFFATGSEVAIAIEAHHTLAKEGIDTRVVSLPCWELFEAQEDAYKAEILLPGHDAVRVSIEAGATLGWRRFVGEKGHCVGLDHFGASAPFEVLYEKFGLTSKRLASLVRQDLDD